jgi:hypothetical protein
LSLELAWVERRDEVRIFASAVVGARVGRHDCVERQRVVGDVVADGEVAEREGVVIGELVDPVIDLLAALVEGAPGAVLLEEVGVLDLTSALTRVR